MGRREIECYKPLISRTAISDRWYWPMPSISPMKLGGETYLNHEIPATPLGLPNTGKLLESGLEQSLIENLQAFLLELGKGFAFVARQQRISTESKDF